MGIIRPVQKAGIQFYLHIRCDSHLVDIIALGGKIFRRSQLHRTSIRELADALNDSLSISGGSHNRSNLIILHSSGKNLRCTGAVLIYQHCQRNVDRGVSVTLHLLFFPIFVLCIHDQSFGQNLAQHIAHRRKHPTWIVTKIHDQLLHAFCLKIFVSILKLLGCHHGKLCNSQIPYRILQHFIRNSGQLHIAQSHCYFFRFICLLVINGQNRSTVLLFPYHL